jgi:hypothetical protein
MTRVHIESSRITSTARRRDSDMQAGGNREQKGWQQRAAWVAVLLLAAALRVPGISPSIAAWHPDEYNFVFWPLLILLGEHIPPVFYYPHLSYYLLAAVNAVPLAFGATGNDFTASTLLRYFWYPEQSLALARAFGVFCAVATVGVTGLITRRLGESGLLAAGLMAVCVIHVRQSPVAGADVPMTLLFVLALWAIVRLESAETTRDYLLAGLLVGLSAALKYQGVLVAIALPVVHLRSGRVLLDVRIAAAAAGALGLFLLTTPAVLLETRAFASGFTELWVHVAPGAAADASGWWRHLSLSLWTAYGPAGFALCLTGMVLVGYRRRAAELGLFAVFLLYLAVIGSAELSFVRYALPLAPLAAILITMAIRRCQRWAPIAMVAVLVPTLYGSARIADLRLRPDTRVEAAAWMARHIPGGAVVCNFGGWAGDPAARTFEDVWWKISHLARSTETPTVAQTLSVLEQIAPPGPFVSYAVQTGNQDLVGGSLATANAFDCDCIVAHEHALNFSSVATDLVDELGGASRVDQRFGAPAMTDAARYDELDALFVPLTGFGDRRQAGPYVRVWQRTAQENPLSWSSRDVFARALVRAASSLVDDNQLETALHLVQQALSSAPQSRDQRLFLQAADVFRRLGLEEPARASATRAAKLTP